MNKTNTLPSLRRLEKIRRVAIVLAVLLLWPVMAGAQEYVATVYSDATFTDEIGSYTSLYSALDAAQDNQGVKLLTDVTENVSFSKPTGTTITLDLNDKVIKASYSSSVINISGGTLIIVDRATDKTTRYWTEDDHDYYWKNPTTEGSGLLTTSGGCITGFNYYGAVGIYVNSEASLNLNGGNVVGNRGSSYGGGIYVNEGTCTIGDDARVCGNSASSGGGIYFYNGTLNIYGGSIDNNAATSSGGGGVYHNNGTLNLSGTPQITGNMYHSYYYGDMPSNLCISYGRDVTLSADPGYLSNGASIGVTKESSYSGSSICFTNEIDKETAISQMAYFFSDDPGYCISYLYDSHSYYDTAVLCLATAKATLKNYDGTVTKGSYAKVTDALAAAANGDQVILINNVEEDVVFSKPGGTSITLDLNNKNISHNSSNNSSRIISISKTGDAEGNATLTIVDNAEEKTPLYWAEHSYWKDWYSSNSYSNDTYAATRVTYGGCIKGGNSGGIIVNSGAVLNLNGGNVVGNTDTQGSGIYVNGGTCIIGSGAKVCGNSATSSLYNDGGGGGVYVNGGSLIINGGNIDNNHVNNGRGGGVSLASGSLNLSGAAKITGNTLRENGATNNLYLSNGRTATISSNLTAGASIGVTMQTPGTFTNGLTAENVDAHMAYFSSDNLLYYVTKDNNQLKLTHYPAVLYTNATFATPVRGYATLNSAIAAAGNDEGVKLFADVNEYVTFQKAGGTTVTLDLNDKKITSSSNANSVIAMSKTGAAEGDVTLNIVDNANTKTTRYWEYSGSNKYWTPKGSGTSDYVTLGGCITGGNGGIQVNSRCVLNLNGGNVVGNNKSSDGGGIYVGGALNISGASIISGNTKSSPLSTPNNIYLPSGKVVTITGAITGSNIGVTMETPGVLTSGLSTNGTASNFTSDDTSKGVGLTAGGEAYLGTLYTISTSASHGSVSASPSSAAINGATVTVTPTADAGYALTSLTYTPTGGVATAIDLTSKQFTMPTANVTISATFALELTSATVSVPNATYNGLAQQAQVKYGETVLTKDTHYTITSGSASQIAVGTTASFTITGTGEYTGTVSGLTFTVDKAALTVTANNHSITYGDAPANNGVTYSGFVSTEDEAVLGGTLAYAYSYTQYDDVGAYTITPSGLTSDNYDITFAAGTLTVGQKPLTITAQAQEIAYGDNITEAPSDVVAEGLVTGDAITAVTLTPSTEAVTSTGTITPSAAATTNGINNYSVTYVHGTLTIYRNFEFSSSDWRTWFGAEDLTVNTGEMETYVVTGVTSSTITVESTEGKIYLGKPMLIKRVDSNTTDVRGYASTTALTPPATSDAYVGGVSTFAGYTEGTVYVLAGSEFVRAKVEADTEFSPSKCFIYLAPNHAASRLSIGGDGTTDIIRVETDDVKDDWYTIGGRKLNKRPKQPGIYIWNGKKVVIK